MLQVGILIHQAKSGRLIIRLSREVRPGAILTDDKGRKLGKVVELIGPVRSPYASIQPQGGGPVRPGESAFLLGQST